MTIQITIIGLGQIGASIGLALEPQKANLLRVGNDIDNATARQAQKMGAVDRLEVNLPNSVRDADLVILALPIDQLRPVVDVIAPDLREGCVVMDTAPARQAVMDWLPAALPEKRFYVGLTPVLNPAYLLTPERGIHAAHADLFKGGQLGVVTPVDTEPGALKMAGDLAGLLGASPIFADATEIDGLMAAAHVLPQLLAAALLHATVEQPGWREARRLAGLPYQEASSAILRSSSAADLAAQATGNRQNTLRVLNDALLALQTLRDEVAAGDPVALEMHLKRLRSAQEDWWKGRLSKEWQQESAPGVQMPEAGGVFGRLLGFNPRKPKKR